MKKLSQLLESINEVDSLLELDFKSKDSFQKYQAKHKMKPTTKVNIAGKDTTVGDEMGDDSETPQAPKKTTGADIEKQADKSGKEVDDIEKDIAGDDFDDMYAGIELDDEDDEPESDDSKEKSSDIYHPDNIGEFDEKNHKFNIMKVNKLNNPERFRKQPVETLENLEGMLSGIRNELDSNYDFAKGFDDNDYSIVEDDLGMRVARFQDELGDNPSESEIEDVYENMRELGNDIESFMKGNYAKATKVNTGRRVGSGMYDNVNPKSSTPLKELSKISTRYSKWLN